MKNLKKILTVLLTLSIALTAVFSLISCTDDNNGDNGNDNNDSNGDNGNDNNDSKFTYTITVVDEDGNGISGIEIFIADDADVLEARTTDKDGKATLVLDKKNDNLGVIITSKLSEYNAPAEDANGYQAVFGDKTEATITLTKKVTETITYTVKVVDQNGNAVEGVTLQICHNVCVQCDPTDAAGESKKNLEKSVSEMTLKVGILSAPEGYTIPEATVEGGYHATIAPGETTVTVEIIKN